MKNYKGLSPNQKNYYVYLAFFEGLAGELYLKVGKTGSLQTRFIDLRKANPTLLKQAYVIDVGEFDFVADGMEYIFKRRLSPLNIHGEWFVVSKQTIIFLKYIMQLINQSQRYDEEVWDDNSFQEYFSIMGHRSEKGWPCEYDWDEILRHNNNYEITPIDIMDDDEILGPVVTRAQDKKEVTRFSDRGNAVNSDLDFYTLAQNKAGRHMDPFIIDIFPSSEEEIKTSTHEGEEFIYVLEGEVEIIYGKINMSLSRAIRFIMNQL